MDNKLVDGGWLDDLHTILGNIEAIHTTGIDFEPLSKVYDERVRQCRVPGYPQSNTTIRIRR